MISCSTTSTITSFNLADGNRLVFVQPVAFKGSGMKGLVDLTYNSTPGKSAICNFSLFSDARDIESVHHAYLLSNSGNDTTELSAIKKLFFEDDECRYSSSIEQSKIGTLCGSIAQAKDDAQIMVVLRSGVYILRASSDFRSAVIALQKNLN